MITHNVRSSAYDRIASEYYDNRHRTCRNFEAATRSGLAKLNVQLPTNGLMLDVGAGKGQAGEFLNVPRENIILLDSSTNMLSLAPPGFPKVLDDATSMPFPDGQFSTVCAFLFDAFAGLNFFAEAFRVLSNGGLFVGTNPSAGWGHSLRDLIKIPRDQTRFKTKDSDFVVAPSILLPHDRLTEMLRHVGFRVDSIQAFPVPTGEDISDDIARVAREMSVDPLKLDVLDLVVARRP